MRKLRFSGERNSLRAPVQVGTQPGLALPNWLLGSLCFCITLSVGERRLFTREGLEGGVQLSCQRKESRGETVARQEGFRGKRGSPPCCRAVISLRTCSYSNHMLCAEHAAPNYEPREGLSSHRGCITACRGRRIRQMESPGPLLS